MAHVSDFINLLIAQSGDAYKFGVEVSHSDPDPKAFDCSEIVEWACARLKVSPVMPDGSWIQVRHCSKYETLVKVSQALTTPGALLFKFSSNPFEGSRPTSSHVAVSLGDGRTIEAKNTASGTGIFSSANRGWTHAGLVPGLDYKPKVALPDKWARESWEKALMTGVVKGDSNPHDDASLQQVVVLLDRAGVL